MKIFRKNIFMWLAIICAFVILCPNVFAGKAGFEEGGEPIPPYGATGDPGGTKLTGIMYIYYLNYHFVEGPPETWVADGATFALRLQREKSSYPSVYYGEHTGELDFGDPASILATLYSILEEQVEADFFPRECLPDEDPPCYDNMCFKIKSVKNEGQLSLFPPDIPPTRVEDIIVLVDVEVAAKPYTEDCYE